MSEVEAKMELALIVVRIDEHFVVVALDRPRTHFDMARVADLLRRAIGKDVFAFLVDCAVDGDVVLLPALAIQPIGALVESVNVHATFQVRRRVCKRIVFALE